MLDPSMQAFDAEMRDGRGRRAARAPSAKPRQTHRRPPGPPNSAGASFNFGLPSATTSALRSSPPADRAKVRFTESDLT
jgi:hypothetical protein